MRMRRVASMLLVGVLAVGINAAFGSPARAATPDPGAYYEIFTPDFWNGSYSECLDVPSASRNSGVNLTIYHCHGYDSNGANQLWQFIQVSYFNGPVYEIVNKNSGLCLNSYGQYNSLQQATCTPYHSWWWIYSAFRADHFSVQSYNEPTFCMATSDSTGRNQTPVVLKGCWPGYSYQENPEQTWQLG